MSDVQQTVRDKYGAIAAAITRSSAEKGSCCGPVACGCDDPITSNLYSDAERDALPADAVSVKAKTAEGLGPEGQGLAVTCEALVTLRRNVSL